jgi:branched-chain amino acid transport system ATP-binding protein
LANKILVGEKIRKAFGGLVALNGIDFFVQEGEIVGLIGPNGSGKTTLFNCITGIIPMDSGKIRINGKEIHRIKPYEVTRYGISRTFQLIKVFRGLTAFENMLVALSHKTDEMWGVLRKYNQQEKEMAFKHLELIGLADKKDRLAITLPAGEQKTLEFSMAMASDPKILLLDEPAAGASLSMIEFIKEKIGYYHQAGKSFMIIEHHMEVIMDLCQRIIVLDYGEKIAEGTPKEIQKNPAVIDAYFGAK